MNSNNLKAIRVDRGMSKAELARRSGLNRVTIGNIEEYKSNPTQKTITLICNALGENPNDIFFNNCVNHEEHKVN